MRVSVLEAAITVALTNLKDRYDGERGAPPSVDPEDGTSYVSIDGSVSIAEFALAVYLELVKRENDQTDAEPSAPGSGSMKPVGVGKWRLGIRET